MANFHKAIKINKLPPHSKPKNKSAVQLPFPPSNHFVVVTSFLYFSDHGNFVTLYFSVIHILHAFI